MPKEMIKAIVLAGGSGRRMGGNCKKQYMLLAGRPILYYSLQTFQDSCVDEIILVTNEAEYCRTELVHKYNLDKVTKIVPGGQERWNSVYSGLLAAEPCSYILIHDGARPMLTQTMIEDSVTAVRTYSACVIGMPVKDTIKIADDEKFAVQTPPRETLWQIQTPQSFSYPLIVQAYQKILEQHPRGITDDAMVIEYAMHTKVKLIQGSYRNIKITTPEDIVIAEAMMHIQLE